MSKLALIDKTLFLELVYNYDLNATVLVGDEEVFYSITQDDAENMLNPNQYELVDSASQSEILDSGLPVPKKKR